MRELFNFFGEIMFLVLTLIISLSAGQCIISLVLPFFGGE